jgi:hypothetical protein
MSPHELVAPLDPYGLPAPAWVFIALSVVTLVLHFIAMGYVFGATLLHVFLALWARRGTVAGWMLRRTEGPLPVAISFTVTLAVAPLLFVQVLYQPVFYSANIMIGHQWFGVVAMMIVGFYLVYLLWGGRVAGRPVPAALHLIGRLAIFGSIVYVMLTMTVNAILEMDPASWKAVRESGGNFLLMHSPILLPRLLHSALAATIIGGVWLVALGARSERLETEPVARKGAAALRRIGSLAAIAGILAQACIGTWMALAETPEIRAMLFGGGLASILWMTALAGVLCLLLLAQGTLTRRPGGLTLALWGVLGLILAGMFSAREAARQIRLAPYMKISDWAVKPQISSLALFLVLFVAALAIVGVMIAWLMQDWRKTGGQAEGQASGQAGGKA